MAGEVQWQIPQWLIPQETPGDALVKGVQAGHLIAQSRLQAQGLALEAQKLAQQEERSQMEFLLQAQRNSILNKSDMARIQGEMIANEEKLKTRQDWVKAAPTLAKWKDGDLDAQLDPSITSGEVLNKSNDIWGKLTMDTTEGQHRTDAIKKYNEVMTGQYSTMEDRALLHSYKPFTSQWETALGITYGGYKEREDAGKLELFQSKQEAITEGRVEVAEGAGEQRGRLQEQRDTALSERIENQSKRKEFADSVKSIRTNPQYRFDLKAQNAEILKLKRDPQYSEWYPNANDPKRMESELKSLQEQSAAKEKQIAALKKQHWVRGALGMNVDEVNKATNEYNSLQNQIQELKADMEASKPEKDEAAPSGPKQIRNTEDYNQIPSGATYIDPNGVTRTKP